MPSVSHVYGFDVFEFDEQAQILLSNNEIIELTNAEFSLLLYFVKNPRTKHKYVDLYEEIFGLEGRSQENTVPMHVSNLRKKLRGFSDKKLIKNIPRVGYRFDADIVIWEKPLPAPIVEVPIGKSETAPEVEDEYPAPDEKDFENPESVSELNTKGRYFSEHLYFVLTSCLLYSSACVVGDVSIGVGLSSPGVWATGTYLHPWGESSWARW